MEAQLTHEAAAATKVPWIEGLSFPVYRRVATIMIVPAPAPSSATEMLTVDPSDLTVAFIVQEGCPTGNGHDEPEQAIVHVASRSHLLRYADADARALVYRAAVHIVRIYGLLRALNFQLLDQFFGHQIHDASALWQICRYGKKPHVVFDVLVVDELAHYPPPCEGFRPVVTLDPLRGEVERISRS